MSIRSIGSALVIALFVGACTAPREPIVEKQGVSLEQMNRDMAQCRQDVPLVSAGNYITNCMRARGYTILDRA